jgi:hypothetical protein
VLTRRLACRCVPCGGRCMAGGTCPGGWIRWSVAPLLGSRVVHCGRAEQASSRQRTDEIRNRLCFVGSLPVCSLPALHSWLAPPSAASPAPTQHTAASHGHTNHSMALLLMFSSLVQQKTVQKWRTRGAQAMVVKGGLPPPTSSGLLRVAKGARLWYTHFLRRPTMHFDDSGAVGVEGAAVWAPGGGGKGSTRSSPLMLDPRLWKQR